LVLITERRRSEKVRGIRVVVCAFYTWKDAVYRQLYIFTAFPEEIVSPPFPSTQTPINEAIVNLLFNIVTVSKKVSAMRWV
jgi:hypothetical protein